MSESLSKAQIEQWVAGRPGWSHGENAIRKQFQFEDFRGSIAFVDALAELAEAAGHHPDITITYSKVLIVLTTHDAGGVTTRDLDLAAQIDQLTRGGPS